MVQSSQESPPPEPTPPPPPVLPTPAPVRASGGFGQPQPNSRFSTLAPGFTPRGAPGAALPGHTPASLQPRGFNSGMAPHLGRQTSGASRSSLGAGPTPASQQRVSAMSNTNYGIGGTYGRGQQGTATPNYQAPQPVEVYKLNSTINAAIPDHIRSQFQCDELGNVLFFTAPPLDVDVGEPKGAALGHSARYLSAMKKREALLERKRKADVDALSWASEERRKAVKSELESAAQRYHEVSEKSRGMWTTEMVESNRRAFERTFGERWEDVMSHFGSSMDLANS